MGKSQKWFFAFLLFHSHFYLDAGAVNFADRCRLLRPVLFVLHWADVIQSRMKSCLVIPEQPIEGFIFGLTKSFKVQAVQPPPSP